MSELESNGMDPRESMKVYPRLDQQYKSKGSLNFDISRSRIFKDRSLPARHDLMVYGIYLLIALSTGLLTVSIAGAE
jgi:hypothetical protein